MTKPLIFELAHLENFAIIEKPCTVLVRNNSRLNFDKVTINDDHPRWLLNLKAISGYNLKLIEDHYSKGNILLYEDAQKLMLNGAIWQDRIQNEFGLPIKGEEIIAVFDFVDDVLRCTEITVIPRSKPKLYSLYSDLKDFNDIKNIINKMNG